MGTLGQEIEEARAGAKHYMELYTKKKNENEMAYRSFLYLLEE